MRIFIHLFFVMTLLPLHAHAEINTAILAGGCFWCVQHDMEQVKGVVRVEAGYAGGDRPSPTYENYHTLDATYKTPHLEVAKLHYDRTVIDFETLVQRFLRTIDPTDGGGQFCDRGPAYRPAIFYASNEEKQIAEKQIAAAEAVIEKPLHVELLPVSEFWPAEEYHQDYAKKNPLKYRYYRFGCGRDARVEELWGTK